MPLSRQETITQALNKAITLTFCDVIDESFRHHVPEGAQTHFKVTLVSDDFTGMPLIKRHRQVNEILAIEFQKGLHALSIHAFTPKEWSKKQEKTKPSPACRDGFEK